MTRINTTMPAKASTDKEAEFEKLKQSIHSKLVDKLDLAHVGDLEGDVLRREIRLVVEHLCDTEDTFLNRTERERLIDEVLDETFGLGPLEMLLQRLQGCLRRKQRQARQKLGHVSRRPASDADHRPNRLESRSSSR